MKKIIAFTLLTIILICSGCSKFVLMPQTNDELDPTYIKACDALKEGDYDTAYTLFTQLGDYKDSKTHLSYFAYLPVEIIAEDDGMGENIVYFQTVFTYDNYGRLLSEEGKYTNDEGPGYSEKHTYNEAGQTYNEAGQLIKTEAISEAGFSTLTFEYDDSGFLVKRVGCTDGANVGGITLYTNDENGRCVEAKMMSYLGIDTENYQNSTPYHTDTTVYTYDAQGNCTKSVSNYGDGQITCTAEYNENGLPTVINSFESEDYISSTLFEYDDKGRCTKISSPYDSTEFKYGEDLLPESAIRTRDGGKPCNVTYKYKLFYLKDGAPKTPFFMDEYLSVFEV